MLLNVPLTPIVSQTVQSEPFYPTLKDNCNTFLSSMPRPSKQFLSLVFSHKNHPYICLLSHD